MHPNPTRATLYPMSKPTNVRLDDTTKARADAIRAASPVPLTTSAVLQEAIRRGLDSIEREAALPAWVRFGDAIAAGHDAQMETKRGAVTFTVGAPKIVNSFEGGDIRAEVCTSGGQYRVDVYHREGPAKWGLVSFQSSCSLTWCEQYAQCVVLGTVDISGIMFSKPDLGIAL